MSQIGGLPELPSMKPEKTVQKISGEKKETIATFPSNLQPSGKSPIQQLTKLVVESMAMNFIRELKKQEAKRKEQMKKDV